MDTLAMSYYYLPLLILLNILKSGNTITNETQFYSNDFRQPRVNGRIVKLYSGPKPQPFVCPGEGFQADPTNCALFYRCVFSGGKYSVFKYQCAPGTVYDPQFEVCNYPQNTRRAECYGFPQRLERLETNSDDAKQEEPLKEIPRPISTKNPIYFEKQTEPAAPSIPTTIPTWLTENWQTDDTKTSENSSHREKSYSCTREGFMGDNEDCHKFYRCISNSRGGFLKYEFSCSGSTIWDDNTQSCNHAWAVHKRSCGNISFGETTASNLEISNEVFDDKIEKDSKFNYGSKIQSTNPHNPISTNQGYLEHTESNSDKKQIKPTYANDVTRRPVWALNNKDENDRNYSGVSTEKQTLLNEKMSNTRVGDTNECKDSGFMADQHDCKKFYRCVDDGRGGFLKYEFTCGEGTAWDENLEACNYIGSVKSCNEKGDSNGQSNQELPNNPSPSIEENTNQNNYGGSIENNNETDENNMVETTTTAANTDSPKPASSSGPDSNDENVKCSSSGFLGDPKNCKVFYRCVDDGKGSYTKYEYKCGEGTVWDSSIEACNHDWAVKNCGANSEQNKEDTTSPTSTTPVTTVSLIQVSSSSTQASETDNNNEGYGQQPSSTSTNSDSNSNSGECTESGFMADIEDCQKFYRCVDDGKGGFTKYEFSCGEGTIWDPSIEACNYEGEPKKCLRQGENQNDETQEAGAATTTVGSTAQESNEVDNGGYTYPAPENNIEAPMEESQDCKNEGFIGDKNNCQIFYRCVQNDRGGFTKYEFKCGEGTIWVQEIQACDVNDDPSKCKSQSTDTTKTTTKNPISTTTEKSNDHTAGTTSNPPINGDCPSEGFYPNKQNCQKFYRCVSDDNGGFKRYDFDCGEATAWDTRIQACNYIEEVERCKNQTQHDEPVETTTTAGSSAQTSVISSTTTQKSTSNATTQASSTTTSLPTTSTSSTTTTTSTPGPSTTPSSNTCNKEGYYGDQNDCKKFYRCVDNGKGGFTKYDFDCGEGTIWDQDKTTCNHPQDVANPSCKNKQETTTSSPATTTQSSSTTSKSTPSTTSSTTSTSSSTTTQSSSTTPKGTTTTTTQKSNCTDSTKKPNSNVTCEKAGYYPDPNDCKKFYRCVDWDGNGQKFSVYYFECGEGTIWDPALETCNHENSVQPPRDCSSNQKENITTQSTTTTDGSTTTESSTTAESTTTEQSTTTDQTTTDSTTTTTTTTKKPSSTTTTTTKKPTSSSTTTTTTKKPASSTTTTTTKKPASSSTTTTTTKKPSSSTTTTTTQKTTTAATTESTTTEQPTTTDESTTQATTTAEQTTQATTQQTEGTTQQTTTEQSTQQTTTEQTTQQTTTDQTTQQSTTQGESTTTESSSTTTDNNQETTTENNTPSKKDCPETDDDQYLYVCPTSFRRHPKYCNLFYQCDEDDKSHEIKVANFRCPNNTIYDEKKTKCVEESKAEKKCDGKIAQRRKLRQFSLQEKDPIEIDRDSFECAKTGNFELYKNKHCTPAFFKCTKTKSGKIRGFVYQCPKNYVYWSISRRCERKTQIHECSHTNSTDVDWSDRREIPTERLNLAP